MPIGFQGGKLKWAPQIVDALEHRFGPASRWPAWFDLCCGSCAVTLEVLRRAPELAPRSTAVDIGPWGWFWTAYQDDPAGVVREVERIYGRTGATRTACTALHDRPVATDPSRRAAQFIVALRGGYMGRLPTVDADGRWSVTCGRGARGKDATFLVERLTGLPRFNAIHGHAEAQPASAGAVVYIDPGYKGITGGHYNDVCDVPRVVRQAKAAGAHVALSHHTPYPGLTGPSVTITGARCHGDVCRRELLIFPA